MSSEAARRRRTPHLARARREVVMHFALRVWVARLHHEAIASRDGHVVVVPCSGGRGHTRAREERTRPHATRNTPKRETWVTRQFDTC